jgi:hypothetical protein
MALPFDGQAQAPTKNGNKFQFCRKPKMLSHDSLIFAKARLECWCVADAGDTTITL